MKITIEYRKRIHVAKTKPEDFWAIHCNTCSLRKTCEHNPQSFYGYIIKKICAATGYGFEEIKQKEAK